MPLDSKKKDVKKKKRIDKLIKKCNKCNWLIYQNWNLWIVFKVKFGDWKNEWMNEQANKWVNEHK